MAQSGPIPSPLWFQLLDPSQTSDAGLLSGFVRSTPTLARSCCAVDLLSARLLWDFLALFACP